jgi:predicted nucleotidyltransferase
MLLTPDMKDLIALLEREKVRYVMVGGLAVNYYGYMRTTQDVDILIFPSAENADKMAVVLEDFGFGQAGISKKLFEQEKAAIHLGTEPNRIDLLTSLKGISNEEIFRHAKRITYSGVSMRIISYKDLLACKKSSDRLKDRADVEELEKGKHRI